jgi:Na+/melibiose symporter-like transporter
LLGGLVEIQDEGNGLGSISVWRSFWIKCGLYSRTWLYERRLPASVINKMPRPLRWFDLVTINIYFTGLTTLAQTMTPLVVPLLVQQFVGEARQGSFYGTARLWSLMTALLVQSLMGMLSDRSRLRFGKRRPFIFAGTLGDLLVIVAIGFTAGLQAMTGYWALFILLILLQLTSNTAHAAAQALIPDLVPEGQRGRFSGIKSILEVPIPVILVSFTIGRLVAAGNLWAHWLFVWASWYLPCWSHVCARQPPSKSAQALD